MISLSVAFILALGTADDAGPRCATGPVVDGVPVIYCPEKWDVNPYVLRRSFFEEPTLRPEFRDRVLVKPARKRSKPEMDITE